MPFGFSLMRSQVLYRAAQHKLDAAFHKNLLVSKTRKVDASFCITSMRSQVLYQAAQHKLDSAVDKNLLVSSSSTLVVPHTKGILGSLFSKTQVGWGWLHVIQIWASRQGSSTHSLMSHSWLPTL